MSDSSYYEYCIKEILFTDNYVIFKNIVSEIRNFSSVLKLIEFASPRSRFFIFLLLAKYSSKLEEDTWLNFNILKSLEDITENLDLFTKLYISNLAYRLEISQNKDVRFMSARMQFIASSDMSERLKYCIKLYLLGSQEYLYKIDLICRGVGLDFDINNPKHLKNLCRKFNIYHHDFDQIPAVESAYVQKIDEVSSENLKKVNYYSNRDFYILNNLKKLNKIPSFKLFLLKSGYISYDISNVGLPEIYVFDSDKKLLFNLSLGGNPFIEDSLTILENLAFIDDIFPGVNPCHFLYDKLPRVDLFVNYVKSFFILIQNEYSKKIFNKIYPKLKLYSPDKKRGTLAIKNMYISSASFRDYVHTLNWNSNKFIPKYFESLIAAQSDISLENYPDKIFISRSDARYRNATNSIELEEYFHKKGYSVVRMSDLEPVEQMAIISNASHIAGIHGAGLTNLIFSQRTNCKVLEIFPETYGSPAYILASNFIGFKYFCFVAYSPNNSDYLIEQSEYSGSISVMNDLTVNLVDLDKFLISSGFED